MPRIDRVGQIDRLIEEYSVLSRIPIDIYLIGGGALMYHGSKMSTKDLDLIVCSEEEFTELRSVLITLGYIDTIPTFGFGNASLKAMMAKGDVRLDIFLEKVCGKLRLSEKMKLRSRIIAVHNNLSLYLCDKGDILIFKSITERLGDTEDCINLIKSGDIDWEVILDEIIDQISSGEQVWITHICAKLHEIADESKIEIPILIELDRMYDEFSDRYIYEHDNSNQT